jgi:GNAT superfamily N-acetyltransferase
VNDSSLNIEFRTVKEFTDSELAALYQLWNQEYPQSIAYHNCQELIHYLSLLNNLNHVLILKEEKVVGWYWDFMRDGNQNFAMILGRNFQGLGIGTACLNRAKTKHSQLFGWVVDRDEFKRADGSTYPSPVAFYVKNGFEILADKRFESEKLSTVQILWEKPLNALTY